MKVLLVDDEFNVREVIRSLGQWQDYGITEVLEASNGKEAKELIERESPEIIFTDVKMPEMNGMELIEWLGTLSYSGKVILITVYDDYSFMRKAIQYSSFDYLLKPIEPDLLNKALAGAVEAWKNEEEERRQKESGLYEDAKRLRVNREVTAACNGEHFDVDEIASSLPEADKYELALLSFYQMHYVEPYIQLLADKLCDQGWGNAFPLQNNYQHCLLITVHGQWLAIEEWMNQHFAVPVRFVGEVPLKLVAELPTSFQCAQKAMNDQNFRSIRRMSDLDDARRIQDIVAFVEENYMEELSLQRLSNQFFLSREHISRKFKQEMGMPLSTYVTELRIEQAKRYLSQTDDKLYTIALKLGYQDEKYFSKLFKKRTGMTPIEYRNDEKNWQSITT
ncbi:response regulator [Salipaludibacillus agaradhaerens]|uniref:Response regulator n=1 Tax=Salipaludibacillus agaradhaerens TaxID=76935 RepID=A0A9Q4B3Y1_SALAG|nr:response regulator [Salipaludibacillus agaradhaerens]MCR6097525.1 response regulator [Salipaludibacillus agaradhaerens]MCR6112991.1 response regulator [Salipaludibacillus agaradhaerens]